MEFNLNRTLKLFGFGDQESNDAAGVRCNLNVDKQQNVFI